MRQLIDNATRFFAVVGAPYITEHHAYGDISRRAAQRSAYEITALSTGSWLNDDR